MESEFYAQKITKLSCWIVDSPAFDLTIRQLLPEERTHEQGLYYSSILFDLILQVDFHTDFQKILPINYNLEGDNSRGHFGFRNGEFIHNSRYIVLFSTEAAPSIVTELVFQVVMYIPVSSRQFL